jgi:CheY-specific phosphatase CheX
MSEFLQQVLRDSVEEVLEKMFFIRALGEEAEEPACPENKMAARLSFDGVPSGSLTLCVTRGAARSISADFLGADEDELTSQQVGEVICELANMICGSVLSRVERAAQFRLSPPQLLTLRCTCEAELARRITGESASHSMGIGGGCLTVYLMTESPVCSMAARHAF